MSLLINIYHRHQLPKGDRELARSQILNNMKASAEIQRMQNEAALSKPSTLLDEIHVIIAYRHLPWNRRVELLHQRYKGNRISHWPQDILMLFAEIFPADGPKQQLSGKQCYNLFKTIIAMALHISEPQPA